MRFLVNILTIGTLVISPLLKSQDINSYNVNAILNNDEKSIEVSQIMKFKNTSNIILNEIFLEDWSNSYICLLYTSPSPRDVEESRMPSSA